MAHVCTDGSMWEHVDCSEEPLAPSQRHGDDGEAPAGDVALNSAASVSRGSAAGAARGGDGMWRPEGPVDGSSEQAQRSPAEQTAGLDLEAPPPGRAAWSALWADRGRGPQGERAVAAQSAEGAAAARDVSGGEGGGRHDVQIPWDASTGVGARDVQESPFSCDARTAVRRAWPEEDVESGTRVRPQAQVRCNPGSFGHPQLCGRPCLHLFRHCANGADCEFCHIPHDAPKQLDKQERLILRQLPPQDSKAMLFPLMLQKVTEHGGCDGVMLALHRLGAACGVTGHIQEPISFRESRRIRKRLLGMSLRHLLTLFIDLMRQHQAQEAADAAQSLLVQLLLPLGHHTS